MTRYRIMTFDPQGVAVPSFDSLESESPFPNLLGNGEFWAEITEPDHDHSACGACDEVYDRGYEDGKAKA